MTATYNLTLVEFYNLDDYEGWLAYKIQTKALLHDEEKIRRIQFAREAATCPEVKIGTRLKHRNYLLDHQGIEALTDIPITNLEQCQVYHFHHVPGFPIKNIAKKYGVGILMFESDLYRTREWKKAATELKAKPNMKPDFYSLEGQFNKLDYQLFFVMANGSMDMSYLHSIRNVVAYRVMTQT